MNDPAEDAAEWLVIFLVGLLLFISAFSFFFFQ